ncbi:MAG: hypothetical protein WD294_09740 [Phycisphaeraceae bacterium]
MEPNRIAVKYFVDGSSVDASAIVPVFHRWIQEGRTADALLDVADYKHVHEGPHTLLVAHEADYVIDLAEGRPGLLYVRKRWGLSGSLRDRVAATLRHALAAAKILADDPQPHSPIAFRTDEVQISFYDRLAAPNTAASFKAIKPELEALLAELYEGADLTLEHVSDEDSRNPLTIKVLASQAPSLDTLVERTEAASTTAG